ncbi:MAPEG family protein [Neisseriaceae bacterium TC5R-5]|nr:MAPEG family protein [Neisseriaceae bacterium TC5R-5]
MFPITAVFAAVFTIMFIKLAFNVIQLRRQHKVVLGDGGIDELTKAMRAHGNFAEYVPIGLVLMACLEGNAAPFWLLISLGVILWLGRLLHARGMHDTPPNFRQRVGGMQLTFASLGLLAASNVIWLACRNWPN